MVASQLTGARLSVPSALLTPGSARLFSARWIQTALESRTSAAVTLASAIPCANLQPKHPHCLSHTWPSLPSSFVRELTNKGSIWVG
ncbi:hypothetical protein E2C01_006406 [Portunus trituberculatus]|uniref:Uncharacterized protein n=1 Tax=Portunus trituberculatus TaxID=210409 RepID=A0A5B7CY44_PORTR|nr:hypothetical protein [Portunus trituberculatus]